MLDDPRCVSRRLALCGIICVLRYNNNDSDDIAWNDDERSKTTPTLATVMNFIIAFSLSLSLFLLHARAHTYIQHERNARHCAVAVAPAASVQLTRSFPFSVISRRTATGSPRIRVDDASRVGGVSSVSARNAADDASFLRF